jgi:hypothetical protein
VQLQKVDGALPSISEGVIESCGHNVHRGTRRRQVVADHRGGHFHECESRGFERLDEARGQTYRDAIAMPRRLPVAGAERQLAGRQLICALGIGSCGHIVVQDGFRLCIGRVSTGVHVSHSAPRLQPDVPDPARLAGVRDRL